MNLEMQLFLQDPESSSFRCEPRRGTMGSQPEEAPHCPFHSCCTIYTPTDTQKTQLLSILAMIYLLLCVVSACVLMCPVHAVPTETHRVSDFLELELQMVVSHHVSAGNQGHIDTLLPIFVFLVRNTLRDMD